MPMDLSVADVQAPAKPLGVLIWPLGIAATGFLFMAAVAVFILWLPIITLFGIGRRALHREEIGLGAPVSHRA